MRAFEKWWKKYLEEHGKSCKESGFCDNPEITKTYASPYKLFYGRGWKASLEWVLNDCVLPNGMISHTLIKKELGEEK